MEWIIAVGIIFWLILRTRGIKARLDELVKQLCEYDKRLKHLESQIGKGSHAESPMMPRSILSEAKSPFSQPAVSEPVTPSVQASLPEPSPEAVSRGIQAFAEQLPPPLKPMRPSPLEEQSRRLERMFLENWTGILGTVVVVAGVTFIGIYTALRLPPFYRFLMTVGAAAALGAASTFLRRRESWQALAEYVRSAAAAIFMFACAASGGLPGLGMQWIEAPTPALVLLLLGIAINLYLAWIIKSAEICLAARDSWRVAACYSASVSYVTGHRFDRVTVWGHTVVPSALGSASINRDRGLCSLPYLLVPALGE